MDFSIRQYSVLYEIVFVVKTVPVWIINNLIIAFEFDSSSSVDQKYISTVNYIYVYY